MLGLQIANLLMPAGFGNVTRLLGLIKCKTTVVVITQNSLPLVLPH
jgi:hypothetical protein